MCDDIGYADIEGRVADELDENIGWIGGGGREQIVNRAIGANDEAISGVDMGKRERIRRHEKQLVVWDWRKSRRR